MSALSSSRTLFSFSGAFLEQPPLSSSRDTCSTQTWKQSSREQYFHTNTILSILWKAGALTMNQFSLASTKTIQLQPSTPGGAVPGLRLDAACLYCKMLSSSGVDLFPFPDVKPNHVYACGLLRRERTVSAGVHAEIRYESLLKSRQSK